MAPATPHLSPRAPPGLPTKLAGRARSARAAAKRAADAIAARAACYAWRYTAADLFAARYVD